MGFTYTNSLWPTRTLGYSSHCLELQSYSWIHPRSMTGEGQNSNPARLCAERPLLKPCPAGLAQRQGRTLKINLSISHGGTASSVESRPCTAVCLNASQTNFCSCQSFHCLSRNTTDVVYGSPAHSILHGFLVFCKSKLPHLLVFIYFWLFQGCPHFGRLWKLCYCYPAGRNKCFQTSLEGSIC